MRDPRIDPKPGDSISREFKTASGGCVIREVERAHGGWVGFYRDNGYQRQWKIVLLSEWIIWARKAQVLERAV